MFEKLGQDGNIHWNFVTKIGNPEFEFQKNV